MLREFYAIVEAINSRVVTQSLPLSVHPALTNSARKRAKMTPLSPHTKCEKPPSARGPPHILPFTGFLLLFHF